MKKVFGERVLGYLGNVKVYLLETNHPIVQIFYLLIAVGGYIFINQDSLGTQLQESSSICLINMFQNME